MRLPIVLAVVAALLGAFALAGCGKSAQDKAQAQVCDARDDISKQVDTLQGLTPTSVSVDAVKQPLQAIGDDLKTIADAQKDLSSDDKQAVQQAVQTFTGQLTTLATSVATGGTSSDQAKTQLQSSLDQLGSSFKSSLQSVKVDCG